MTRRLLQRLVLSVALGRESAMPMELLNAASKVAMLCFVVSSMLAMGVGLLVGQIIEPVSIRPFARVLGKRSGAV